MSIESIPSLSPRAIEGFARRDRNKNSARQRRKAEGYGPTICAALKRMADRPYDMRQIEGKFGFPDDPPGTPRYQISTARQMHCLGLVRIIGREGTFLELTAKGMAKAAALVCPKLPKGRPGRLPGKR